MNIDLHNYNFWIMAAIWFTVPIVSWLWCVVTFPLYRKLTNLVRENAQMLEQVKIMRDQAESLTKDSMVLRTKVEEELRDVTTYYTKIKTLLDEKKL